MRTSLCLTALLAFALPMGAYALDTDLGDVETNVMVTDISDAWGLAFLPDGALLFTRKSGALMHRAPSGAVTEIGNVPRVRDAGQGGLLDVMVPNDFAESREVFLTFSKPQGRGEGTALVSARLMPDHTRLEYVAELFELTPGSAGGRHFGSRVVEGGDGKLYMTIGDRGDSSSAQDLSRENGSVVRLNRDGTIPSDNPFVGQDDTQPAIWSYGHRNPQGAAVDASGQVWTVEHGARGGDEVNRIARGANFGWPVISYGTHYSGAPIGEGQAKDGLVQPEYFWDPSIAPSGMMIYSGALWPEWEGDIFIGSLKFNYISRLEGDPMSEVEQIEGEETLRVRDIEEAPDGSIWFISEGQSAIYRMAPR